MPQVTNAMGNIEIGSEVAEVELVYRNETKPQDRPFIPSSHEAYNVFLKTWDMNKIELQEQFRIMLLDRRNACLGVSTVATGGITNCTVDLKLVFAMALKARATSIILAHNHPSGSKSASDADLRITAQFMEAGHLLQLPVLDHLIVTKDGYTSLKDDGIVRVSF